MKKALINGRVFDGKELQSCVAVILQGNVISALVSEYDLPDSIETRWDLDGHILAPGLIDIQVNGGGGFMFNDKPSVALGIVNDAVDEAVKLVAAVVKALAFERPYPLALAGSVACRNQFFRDGLLSELNKLQPPPETVTVVDEPVMGCLTIARQRLSGNDQIDVGEAT